MILSFCIFFSPSTAAQKNLNTFPKAWHGFAALSLHVCDFYLFIFFFKWEYNYSCCQSAKQHCIISRLEPYYKSKESLWSVSVLDPLLTLLYASPLGCRKPYRGKEGRGGGDRTSISPAQSALSGLAVTAGGQARNSPNLSLSFLMLFLFVSVSVTEIILFPPPFKCFFS